MENVSLEQLQELSNMLWEESHTSKRNAIAAWVESKNTNPEHASFSGLMAIAEQSVLKDKIQNWLNKITNKDAIQINPANEMDVRQQAADGEGVEQGNSESEKSAEESKTKSEEEIKVKKPRKKSKQELSD